MADLTVKVLGEEGVKWETLTNFRKRKRNISLQALQYALNNDMLDYIRIGHKGRAIILNKKAENYKPNNHLEKC